MQLARVIGTVVSTHKDPRLTGLKLLVLQPLAVTGEPSGRPIVGADSVGAGEHEDVFFVRGREAGLPFGRAADVPVDASVVGIVDHWTADDAQLRSS